MPFLNASSLINAPFPIYNKNYQNNNETLHKILWLNIFNYICSKKRSGAFKRGNTVHSLLFIRTGSIPSAADMIHIRYGPCWYDTYSIWYTCTWFKVSKSRILDFNNNVNALGWSIQWSQQILVLKQTDHLSSVYHSFIHKVFSWT